MQENDGLSTGFVTNTELIIKGSGGASIGSSPGGDQGQAEPLNSALEPPAHNPQADGASERAVQEILGELRALESGLAQRSGTKTPTSFKIMQWIVELAPVIIVRCFVEHDVKTPHSRLMGKHSSKEMVEIGERALAKVVRSRRSTRTRAPQPRWEDAIWVGWPGAQMNIWWC